MPQTVICEKEKGWLLLELEVLKSEANAIHIP